MGHPNTKRHKANHGGYKGRPTKSEVKANKEFWSQLKNDSHKLEQSLDELNELFGETAKEIIKDGTQLKLF